MVVATVGIGDSQAIQGRWWQKASAALVVRQNKRGEAQQGALELLLVLKAERTTGASATPIAPSASACTVERIPFELTELPSPSRVGAILTYL